MTSKRIFVSLCAGVLVFGMACGKKKEMAAEAAPEAAPEPVTVEVAAPPMAMATLIGAAESGVTGNVVFKQDGGTVSIVAEVSGVEPGAHGFHIHEIGDCSSADFKSAGGHFNPAGVPHGGPADGERHLGDLGNIVVGEDGIGRLEVSSEQITVEAGDHSVVGRAVVLHAKEDDLVSQPTGDAGSRLACGVIG